MNRRRACFAFGMALALGAWGGAASAAVVYVNKAAPGPTFDGATWATAFTTVQAGLNSAVAGDEVWVAAGTYGERITLKAGVALYGGFAGTETLLSQRNWAVKETVLDGSQGGSVVTAPAGATPSTRIDGFVLRNGSALNGGGVYCDGASPTIAHNRIERNVASSGPGGIVCAGGAVPTIIDNVFAGNSGVNGGGVGCYSSASATIVNNTFVGNFAAEGAGIYAIASSPLIANNIIAFNSSGVYKSASANPTLKNNCTFGNGAYDYAGFTLVPTGSNGNISADPTLTAYAHGEIHLQPSSPCVDSGDFASAVGAEPDWDGQGRVQGAGVDMGADEADGTAWPGVAPVVHVSLSGNDSNDGNSWASAKRTIGAALAAAAPRRGEVWVGAGAYSERITLGVYAFIYGGFGGTETARSERNWQTQTTVVDGGGSGSVVSFQSAAYRMACVDGFTIRNGNATNGGGIVCTSSSPVVANNVITGNTASSGGGIYCNTASPAIVGNTITANSAGGWGGGLSVYNGAARVEDNVIDGNRVTSAGEGGGIYQSGSGGVITRNTIANNAVLSGTVPAGTGGGLFLTNSNPDVSGNVISGNVSGNGGGIYAYQSAASVANNSIGWNTARSGASASDGGGFYLISSPATVINNTIVGNGASRGGGVSIGGSSAPILTNNLIAFCSSGIHHYATVASTLRSNCVFGNGSTAFDGLPDPTGIDGNIASDPLLASPAFGDLHLQPASPCRDAGDTSAVQTGWLDADGQARVQGAAVDIGADESDGTLWPSAPPVVVRVSLAGSDTQDGTSWALAKRSVQAAIDSVASSGGEVWVSAGTYSERVTLKTGAHLYGGFVGSETARDQRDWEQNVTVLDGGAGGSVVAAADIAPLRGTIDGFTIRNGSATDGGGMILTGAYPEVSHALIAGNQATGYGGGIYSVGGSPVIRESTLSGNIASWGGGICWSAGSPAIIACAITDNRATNGWGGGLYGGEYASVRACVIARNQASVNGGGIACNGSPLVVDNTIEANATGDGAGIHCNYASPRILNNRIRGNQAAGYGGGIFAVGATNTLIANNMIVENASFSGGGGIAWSQASPGVIANNTVVGNVATWEGGGLHLSYGATVSLTNNLIAFCSSGVYANNSTPPLRNNCAYGNRLYNFSGLVDPTGANGNIAADPQIASLAYGNAHLQPGSPCRDAGDPSAVQADWLDIDGQPRVQGGGVDIGADESDATAWPTGPPTVVRVHPAGNDANNGSTWALAKRTVQAGIDAAAAGGGDVWIAAGTYSERVILKTRVHAFGGFAGTESSIAERNPVTQPVVLDGAAAGTVVTASGIAPSMATLDGVTVRNGTATTVVGTAPDPAGGGILCIRASPSIQSVAVADNTAGYGGGVACLHGSMPTLTACTIDRNHATSSNYGGGGLYVDNVSLPTVSDCLIRENDSYRGGGLVLGGGTVVRCRIFRNSGAYGGGFYCGYGAPSILQNIIRENSAFNRGGGIDLEAEASPATIAGNLFVANTSPNPGGGVYATGTSAHLIANNTFVGQSAFKGAGLCFEAGAGTVVNNLVAYNVSGVFKDAATTLVWRNNCVYANDTYNYSGFSPDPTGVAGNIAADPAFADLQFGNLHLQPASPCRDTGDSSVVQGGWLDMDGQPRIQGGAVDIGADETDGTLWPTGPTVVRVSPDGNDANDGSTWTLAKRTVQSAIDTLAFSGGEVWVKSGVYPERVRAGSFTYLYGGFSGSETSRNQRSVAPGGSTLDGGWGGSVVTIANAGAWSALDGFRVRNSTGSGAVYCTASSPRIANNVVTGNRSTGIYCAGPGGQVFNNVVAGNSAGIYAGGTPGPSVIGNTVAGNGTGISIGAGSPVIVNNIAAFCSYGIYSSGSGSPVFRNNCAYGNTTSNYYGVVDPTGTNGNLSADPLLADLSHGNLHIQPSSSCRDVGDSGAVPAATPDMDGQPRVQGAAVDIGADESDGTAWSAAPTIIRVSPSGSDANDGSTWAGAKRTAQAAVDALTGGGGEVWVSAGVYGERVSLGPFVSLYGGFVGTESARTERNGATNPTVIDGQGVGSPITIATGLVAAEVDGFTIRGGLAANGGGVNCSGRVTISHNTIEANLATGLGGGVYCASGASTIHDNLIVNNGGGGVACDQGAQPTVVNNTIHANDAPNGAGLYIAQNASPTVANNILASGSSGIYRALGGSGTLRNNCVFGNRDYNYAGMVDPTGTSGNISADPSFVDVATRNLHLAPASPCVEAGNNPDVPAGSTDLDGKDRILGARVDIGAYEYAKAAVPTITPNGGTFSNTVAVTLASATAGTAIRYSTDGTAPTPASTLYTAPFSLTASATVQARAYRTGYDASDIASASFTITGNPVSIPLPLAPGYNLISLPLIPQASYTAESLAQEVKAQGGTVTSVLKYANGAFTTHPVGTTVNNFAIAVGSGYFLRCTAASTWTVTGFAFTATSAPIALSAGYNLVGLPLDSLTSYTAERVGTEANGQGGSVSQVLKYENGGFVTHPVGTAIQNFTLATGKGYFIRCGTASTWTVVK